MAARTEPEAWEQLEVPQRTDEGLTYKIAQKLLNRVALMEKIRQVLDRADREAVPGAGIAAAAPINVLTGQPDHPVSSSSSSSSASATGTSSSASSSSSKKSKMDCTVLQALRQTSSDKMPSWWNSQLHDMALLRGVYQYGFGQVEDFIKDPILAAILTPPSACCLQCASLYLC